VEQFNRILETRDTARGLIVNMRDVLCRHLKISSHRCPVSGL